MRISALVLMLAIGCSGSSDPNRKIVLDYVQKQHGPELLTVVKMHGTVTSDDKLAEFLDTIIDLNKQKEQLTESSILAARERMETMDASVDDVNTLLKDRETAMRAAVQQRRKVRDLEELKSCLPFAATRLVYRAPDDRANMADYDRMFIIKDGEINQVVDVKSDHPFAGFAERAFHD